MYPRIQSHGDPRRQRQIRAHKHFHAVGHQSAAANRHCDATFLNPEGGHRHQREAVSMALNAEDAAESVSKFLTLSTVT